MDRSTYKDGKVVQAARQFVTLKINTDKDKAKLADKYKIEALPTILFLDGNGKVVHQFLGYKPPTEFIAEMKAAQRAAKKK